MPDVSHQWGSDLSTSSTGDLATVTDAALGQQRLLRRLLTNPGEYIWETRYGAGLAQFIGEPADALRIRAVIRSQMFKEPSIARNPEPVIDIQLSPGGVSNALYVHIRYVDAFSGQTQLLSLPVGS